MKLLLDLVDILPSADEWKDPVKRKSFEEQISSLFAIIEDTSSVKFFWSDNYAEDSFKWIDENNACGSAFEQCLWPQEESRYFERDSITYSESKCKIKGCSPENGSMVGDALFNTIGGLIAAGETQIAIVSPKASQKEYTFVLEENPAKTCKAEILKSEKELRDFLDKNETDGISVKKILRQMKEEYAERIVFISSAKKENNWRYEDLDLVEKSLVLLSQEYFLLKTKQIRQDIFDKRCSSLGLEEGPAISKTEEGKHEREYKKLYHGEKKELDRHLKKGKSRNPNKILRIYFFWDEKEEKVVVGHLTTHLTSRST